MPNIGLNFSPTQSGNTYGNPNGQRSGSPSSPVMDAIKILSFRVPTVLGSNAPVAQPLIGGAGGNAGSGLDNSALVLNWLNRFFGQHGVAGMGTPAPFSRVNLPTADGNAMPPMGSSAPPTVPIGGPPSPNVVYGTDPNATPPGSAAPGAMPSPPPAPQGGLPGGIENASLFSQGLGKFDAPDYGGGFGGGRY